MEPIRVVEPSDNNVQVQVCSVIKILMQKCCLVFNKPNANCDLFHVTIPQEDMLTELMDAREAFPEPLEKFQARTFIKSKNRARGSSTNLPPFSEIATSPNPDFSSTEVKSLATLKALLLMIEAALPEGSVLANSTWITASSWRNMVQNANGAAALMGCLVLFEDALDEKWIEPHAYHLLSCMPRHWRAIQDASLSGVALRIWILDNGIQFAKTEKLKNKGGIRKKK